MAMELAPELEAAVKRRLATGRYESEQAVLREALCLLDTREALIAAIEKGDRDIADGRCLEFDLEGLHTFRDRLICRAEGARGGFTP